MRFLKKIRPSKEFEIASGSGGDLGIGYKLHSKRGDPAGVRPLDVIVIDPARELSAPGGP